MPTIEIHIRWHGNEDFSFSLHQVAPQMEQAIFNLSIESNISRLGPAVVAHSRLELLNFIVKYVRVQPFHYFFM